MSRLWAVAKVYLPVSMLPAFVITAIYIDWSKTQTYKKQKELERLGLQREFDKRINL